MKKVYRGSVPIDGGYSVQYLNIYEVQQEVEQPQLTPQEDLWFVDILDVSGSMYSQITHMQEAYNSSCLRYPNTARQTVIHYNDSARVVFDGVVQDYKSEQYPLRASGLTHFEAPLKAVQKLIETNTKKTPIILSMYTDGASTGGPQDVPRAVEILKDIAGSLGMAQFVAFGSCPDVTTMEYLSQASGGSVLRSVDTPVYRIVRTEFVEESLKGTTSRDVLEGLPGTAVFSVAETSIVNYTPNSTIHFQPNTKTKRQYLYSITPKLADDAKLLTLTFEAVERNEQRIEYIQKGLYAAIDIFLRRGHGCLAMAVCRKLGDSYVAELCRNVWSADSLQEAQLSIRRYLRDRSKRMHSREFHFASAPTASVMDVLSVLAESNHNALVDFEYTGRGSSTRTTVTDVSFKSDQSPRRFTVIPTEETANMSIRVVEKGSLVFGETVLPEATQLNLPPEIPGYRYRSYNIIRDGLLVMPSLTVVLSDWGAIDKLRQMGIVVPFGKPFVLKFSDMPVYNTHHLQYALSLPRHMALAAQDLLVTIRREVLKFALGQLTPKAAVQEKTPTETFLSGLGISPDGCFNPKTTTKTDGVSAGTRQVHTLHIFVKGQSNPKASLKAFFEAKKTGKLPTKELNSSCQYAQEYWHTLFGDREPTEMDRTMLTNLLGSETQTARSITMLRGIYILALLGNAEWFRDYSRETFEYVEGDQTLVVKCSTKEVEVVC